MHNLLALPAGTELVEDYRIVRVLGAGGFGLTYLAREETLDRSVTIKEYFPSDFAAREATLSVRPRSIDAEADYGWGLERFIEEAQTLARFDHPNINPVYRYFRANNTAYIVLQFEEGQSFKAWLAGLGRAPRQAELDEIIGPLLDALEMIHGGTYLHRDIAPDNIIIRKSGAPVLIDFGSARGEMVQLSKTVSALVKPGYSPYEQYGISGRQQGPWTDIYSLGASLYQAISGKRPTDAPTRMVADDYRPAAQVALSSYRPQFLAAIDHALKLKVEDRPPTIAAWRRALSPPVVAQAAAPKRPAGVILAPAPAVPLPPLARIPNIFKRRQPAHGAAAVPAAGPAARPAPAPAPATAPARTRLKHRLVRLLEGVAARPAGDRADAAPPATAFTSQPPAALAPLEPPPPAPAAVAAVVAPRAAVKPAKAERRRWFAKAAKPVAPAAPAIAQPKPRPVRAPRGSRAVALKLLTGAVASALLLSYQDQIRTAWRGQGWPLPAFMAATPAPVPAAAPRRRVEIRAAAVQAAIPSAAVARESVPVPRPVDEAVLKGHRGAVQALTFVSGGKALASTGIDGTLRLWDVAKGELIRTIEAGENPISALAVHDRVAAIGHQDGAIALWDLDRGQRLRTFKRNDAMIWSVAFAGDTQRVLSAGHDWAVALWDQRSDAGPLHLFEGHENAVQAVAFGNRPGDTTGLIATGGADKAIKLWNGADYSAIRGYRGHRDFISALAFSPDSAHLASGSFDKTVRIWSTTDGGTIRTLRGHKGRVTSVAFSSDNQILASASEDGTVRLWDWKRGRVVRTLAGHTGGVRSVAFSADGKYVATAGEDGTIRLWDAVTLPRATASRS